MDGDGLNLSYVSSRYALLSPVHVPKHWLTETEITRSAKRTIEWIKGRTLLDEWDAIAFDFETNSLEVFGNPDFRAVGLALSHGYSAIYLDLSPYDPKEIYSILYHIFNRTLVRLGIRTIAHNLYYDASVVAYYLGCVRGKAGDESGWKSFYHCTYYLFRMYSSEGWAGQQFGLKTVMTDLLLWSDTNETRRDEWLIENGYIKGNGAVTDDDCTDVRWKKLNRIQNWTGKKPPVANPAEMWRCPADILGEYAQLDAFSTYHFYREVLLPVLKKFDRPFLQDIYYPAYRMWIRGWIDNGRHGMRIDRDKLIDLRASHAETIRGYVGTMWKDYAPDLLRIRKQKFEKFLSKHPVKIEMKRGNWEGRKEPKKRVKSGMLNRTWIKWAARCTMRDRFGVGANKRTCNSMKSEGKFRYLKWMWDRRFDTVRSSVRDYWRPFIFNPNSTEGKRIILYPEGSYKVIKEHRGPNFGERGEIQLTSNGVKLEMTKSGELPTGADALTALRPKSLLLEKYNRAVKERQFMTTLLSKLRRADDGAWLYHVQVKVPGTHTLRPAGSGGFNILNPVKSSEFLSCFLPRYDNELLLQADFSAIEPVCETQASQDALLMKLYGPNAKANDLYIFNMVLMGGELERAATRHGYDPDNPTKEAIDKVKSNEKKNRGISKTTTLADTYGGGTGTIHRKLCVLGIKQSFNATKTAHQNLKRKYEGKRDYVEVLEYEWERYGFTLDPLGMPVCCDESKKKDLKNRNIQRVGHSGLVIWLWKYELALWESGIPYTWLVRDFYDEMILSMEAKYISTAKRLVNETTVWLNKMLNGDVTLVMEPQVAATLAEVKVEKFRNDEDEDIYNLVDELNEDNCDGLSPNGFGECE